MFCRETYEKQKIDVKAKTQEKKTAERTLETKVSFYDLFIWCFFFFFGGGGGVVGWQC